MTIRPAAGARSSIGVLDDGTRVILTSLGPGSEVASDPPPVELPEDVDVARVEIGTDGEAQVEVWQAADGVDDLVVASTIDRFGGACVLVQSFVAGASVGGLTLHIVVGGERAELPLPGAELPAVVARTDDGDCVVFATSLGNDGTYPFLYGALTRVAPDGAERWRASVGAVPVALLAPGEIYVVARGSGVTRGGATDSAGHAAFVSSSDGDVVVRFEADGRLSPPAAGGVPWFGVGGHKFGDASLAVDGDTLWVGSRCSAIEPFDSDSIATDHFCLHAFSHEGGRLLLERELLLGRGAGAPGRMFFVGGERMLLAGRMANAAFGAAGNPGVSGALLTVDPSSGVVVDVRWVPSTSSSDIVDASIDPTTGSLVALVSATGAIRLAEAPRTTSAPLDAATPTLLVVAGESLPTSATGAFRRAPVDAEQQYVTWQQPANHVAESSWRALWRRGEAEDRTIRLVTPTGLDAVVTTARGGVLLLDEPDAQMRARLVDVDPAMLPSSTGEPFSVRDELVVGAATVAVAAFDTAGGVTCMGNVRGTAHSPVAVDLVRLEDAAERAVVVSPQDAFNVHSASASRSGECVFAHETSAGGAVETLQPGAVLERHLDVTGGVPWFAARAADGALVALVEAWSDAEFTDGAAVAAVEPGLWITRSGPESGDAIRVAPVDRACSRSGWALRADGALPGCVGLTPTIAAFGDVARPITSALGYPTAVAVDDVNDDAYVLTSTRDDLEVAPGVVVPGSPFEAPVTSVVLRYSAAGVLRSAWWLRGASPLGVDVDDGKLLVTVLIGEGGARTLDLPSGVVPVSPPGAIVIDGAALARADLQ